MAPGWWDTPAARGQPGAIPNHGVIPFSAQLSLAVHGPEKSLEFQARAPGTVFVSAVFAGKAVASLFDGRWHKVAVAVQSRAVSVHLDCASISSKPLAPRRALAPEGNAFLGLDAVRGTPVRVSPCGVASTLCLQCRIRPCLPLTRRPLPAAVRHPASSDLLRRRAGQTGGVLRDLGQWGESPRVPTTVLAGPWLCPAPSRFSPEGKRRHGEGRSLSQSSPVGHILLMVAGDTGQLFSSLGTSLDACPRGQHRARCRMHPSPKSHWVLRQGWGSRLSPRQPPMTSPPSPSSAFQKHPRPVDKQS